MKWRKPHKHTANTDVVYSELCHLPTHAHIFTVHIEQRHQHTNQSFVDFFRHHKGFLVCDTCMMSCKYIRKLHISEIICP